MKFLISVILCSLPLITIAEITREFNGIEYYLVHDLNTADGECFLRGHEKAREYLSVSTKLKNVIALTSNGNDYIKLPVSKGPYSLIDYLVCE